MRRFFFILLALFSVGLFLRVGYLVAAGPAEPALNAPDHNAIVALLDHMFRQAAYAITWAIQLGYLAWLGLKWSARNTEDVARGSE